jgi:sec-independent protein translocase protein TatC
MARLRPVDFEDRLTLVEHLDELRSRIIVCLLALAVAVGLCAWQNHLLLDLAKEPLPDGFEPITFGVTEPFVTTFTNAAYAAILLSLPVILYQVYAFVLPAFSPVERRVATPLLLLVPFLFIGGVVFCYFIVLPPAIDFLLEFNADEFNTQIRARDYYSFVTLTMLAMGLGFQVPVGILAAVRLGVTTPEKLRRNRRYAFLGCAVVAALLPTIDPVTMMLETIPLYLLYELSIVLAQAFGRPPDEVEGRVASAEGS